MSGIDEQGLEKCPLCNDIPLYWGLGNDTEGSLVWMFTKTHSEFRIRGSIRFSMFTNKNNMSDVESHINNVWCCACQNKCRDESFVKHMFRKAKQFEREGRVEQNERSR